MGQRVRQNMSADLMPYGSKTRNGQEAKTTSTVFSSVAGRVICRFAVCVSVESGPRHRLVPVLVVETRFKEADEPRESAPVVPFRAFDEEGARGEREAKADG